MAVQLRREPSDFWRRVLRGERRVRQPIPPALPLGTLVRVPDRGDVFERYQAGPAAGGIAGAPARAVGSARWARRPQLGPARRPDGPHGPRGRV